MAKYNLDNYLEKDGLGFPLNFRRGNPNPLDNSSVWSSLDAAKNYAATDPVAYVGQILTVVETVVIDADAGTKSTKVTAYSIQDEAGTLKEIGSDVGYDDTDLITRVTANEEAIAILNGDDTVEGSVDKKVADKVTAEIDAFAEKISDDKIVNTFKELVDYVADHGSEAANMAKDISNLQDLVGTTSVADQIIAAVSDKIVSEDGKGLSSNDFTDTLLTKLNGIADGAQVNVIESVKVGGTLLNIDEKSVNIPVATDTVLGVVKASEEVTVAEDGTLNIGTISFSKIVQDEDDIVVFDGGYSI